MKPNKANIAVVIATFNGEHFLREQLDSVFALLQYFGTIAMIEMRNRVCKPN